MTKIERIRAKIVQPEVLRREREIASFLAGIKRSSERGEVTVIEVAQVQALRAGLRGYQAAAEDILECLARIL